MTSTLNLYVIIIFYKKFLNYNIYQCISINANVSHLLDILIINNRWTIGALFIHVGRGWLLLLGRNPPRGMSAANDDRDGFLCIITIYIGGI